MGPTAVWITEWIPSAPITTSARACEPSAKSIRTPSWSSTAPAQVQPSWRLCDYLAMEPDDPEKRIRQLERELADAKALAREQELRAAGARQVQQTPRTGGTAAYDARLAPAPRKIPMSFLLADLLPFRWWYVWTLFMVGVAPIAIWIATPMAFSVAAVVTLVVIYGFQLWSARNRLALLRWGQVATVTGTEILSRGTYYSGTTWYNAPLPVAHGWVVSRPLYSGPSTKTLIRYTLDGHQGELMMRGREYYDGVVLAEQRNPARALCVTSFAYDLDRDDAGNWIGKIRPRLALGMTVWLVLVVVWLGLAAAVGSGFAANLVSSGGTFKFGQGRNLSVPQGGRLSVGGNSVTKAIACNDSNLTLSGNSNTFTVTGHCVSLNVSGVSNHVTVDDADAITASGISNSVIFHSGSPNVTRSGISVTVQQG